MLGDHVRVNGEVSDSTRHPDFEASPMSFIGKSAFSVGGSNPLHCREARPATVRDVVAA